MIWKSDKIQLPVIGITCMYVLQKNDWVMAIFVAVNVFLHPLVKIAQRRCISFGYFKFRNVKTA